MGDVGEDGLIASYWVSRSDGKVECTLCPNHCIIMEGARGICGVRGVFQGELHALTYGLTTGTHVDPIEKKPIYHMAPGSKTYSIGGAGCNLGCVHCQNHHIAHDHPFLAVRTLPEGLVDGRSVPRGFILRPPEELVSEALSRGCGSIAYTYNEPTVWFEYALETSRIAREAGLRNVAVTNGYILEEPMREWGQYLDAMNVDLKGMTDEFYRETCRGRVGPVLDTLRLVSEMGILVEVTNLIIPGRNDSRTGLEALVRFVRDELGPGTPLHFSAFHPEHRLRNIRPTPLPTLKMAADIAREAGMEFVYLGNVQGRGFSDTVCPGCGVTVIERSGFAVKSTPSPDGSCPGCGRCLNLVI